MKNRSIVVNLSFLVVLLMTMASGLTYFSLRKIDNRFYNNERTEQMTAVARVIAITARSAVAAHKLNSLEEIVNDVIVDMREIDHLVVFDKAVEPLFNNGIPENETAVFRKYIVANRDKIGKTHIEPGVSIGSEKYTLIVAKMTVVIGSGEDRKEHVSGYVILTFQPEPVLQVERMKQVAIFGNSIARTVRMMVDTFNFSEAKAILTELQNSNPNIVFCYIIDPGNMILIHPDAEMEGKQLEDDRTRRAQEVNPGRPVIMQEYRDAKWGRIVDSSFLIRNGRNKIGVLRIGYSMENLYRQMDRIKLIMAVLVIAFMLVASAISIIAARRFAAPIQKLAAIAREIGGGNLDIEVKYVSGGRELNELAGSFNDMIRGLKERNMIKDTFSRYVSKQVADEILNDPNKISLGGESKEVTILFSDIRGFTTLAEKLPAELVVRILNEYFNVMVDCVFMYEGTLDKYIGDAIMAVFGTPTLHDDDPMRAIRTAVRMRDELEELNDIWMNKDGLPPLRIGIGIHTGEVIAGNIGHMQRMEYTVIGDSVNLASRIESLTKEYHCSILISEITYGKVKDLIDARYLDSVTVKGKTKSVKIYELLDVLE